MNIQALIAAGYTAKQALNYITKMFPALSPNIKKVAEAGYTAEQILDFVGKAKKKNLTRFAKGQQGEEPYPDEQTSNPLIQGAEATKRRAEGIEKTNPYYTIGKPAAQALGAYALSRAIPSDLAQQLLGHQGSQQMDQAPQMEQGQQQLQPNPSEMPQETAGLPQETPENAVNSTNLPPENAVNASDLFEQMGISKQVRQMASGQSPDVVAKVLEQHMLSPAQKKWLKTQTNVPLPNLISQFVSEPTAEPQSVQSGAIPVQSGAIIPEKPVEEPIQKPIQSKEEVKQEIETPEPQKPPIKGDTIISPEGRIGKIVDIRNGIVSYRQGKETKHRKLSDILTEPEEIKKAKIVFDPTTIPEEMRSAALGWVMSTRDKKELSVMYGPSGEFVKYTRKDGSPIGNDEIKKIQEGMVAPVTSGDTFMGVFDTKIADSRGSHVVHEFKKQAQERFPEEEEADDPNKPYWVEPLDSEFIHGLIKAIFDKYSERTRTHGKAQRLAEKTKKHFKEVRFKNIL